MKEIHWLVGRNMDLHQPLQAIYIWGNSALPDICGAWNDSALLGRLCRKDRISLVLENSINNNWQVVGAAVKYTAFLIWFS